MRNTIICTVGTSLIGNLDFKRLQDQDLPNNFKDNLHNYLTQSDWVRIGMELQKIEPTHRICGAEINTIAESRNKQWLQYDRLVLLVSDTEKGTNSGNLLKAYFKDNNVFGFRNVDISVIEGLKDDDPKSFKTKGLRNMVVEVGNCVTKWGTDNVVIDATGGYKAQIAVAVIIGQSLNIPVLYKHELFAEVIDFPPLPISLDYDLLGENADVLLNLERGKTFELRELASLNEKLKVFITDVEIEDGRSLYELSAFGQLFITSFRIRNPVAPKLKILAAEDRQEPTFRDDHYPKVFKKYVNKIWRENQWIKKCYSLPYDKQDQIRANIIRGKSFYVQSINEDFRLTGIYLDRDNFGARFGISLSDDSIQSMNWAAEFLNRKYNQ